MLRKYPKIFQDPHIDYPIYDLQLPFQEYIKQSEKIIANTRQDLTSNNAEKIIKNNAPFELKPQNESKKTGILLIHGLLDSPFMMRDMAYFLQAQGFLVRVILLPGLGTVPGALLSANFSQWQQVVTYGVLSLKKEVEKIFLLGYSTGALLAMDKALRDPTIAGLILLTPALKINSSFAFLSNPIRAIGKVWVRTKWFYLAPEIDPYKYQSFPINAIYQVYQLGRDFLKNPGGKIVNCPMFMILTHEDKVICSDACIDYFKKTNHPLNEALIYSGKPLFLSDPRVNVKTSAYPDMNILNFSHIGMPVSPDNWHYGKEGHFKYASHIQKNNIYGAFNNTNLLYYKLLKTLNLTQFNYNCLSFNPDFDFMMNKITNYINKVIFSSILRR